MAKGQKEVMQADIAADIAELLPMAGFCRQTCRRQQLPRAVETACGTPGPKDAS